MDSGRRKNGGRRQTRGRKRVLIVDDHPVVRSGVAELLRHEPDLISCGEASCASAAIDLISRQSFDIVLLDISLKGKNGIELMEILREMRPTLPVLVLSMHDENLYAERALRAGARGYVMKQEAARTILKAVRRVLNGQMYFSSRIASRLLREFACRPSGRRTPGGLHGLSNRQLEVFEGIGNGLTTREIAARLRIGTKTVETHRAAIKRKLNCQTLTELVHQAVRWTSAESGGREPKPAASSR